MSTFRSIEWKGDRLVLLDQRRIPEAKVFLELTAPEEVAAAIREMAVRGAPAIGAAAAFGVVLAARRGRRWRRPTRSSGRRAPPRSTCSGRSTA